MTILSSRWGGRLYLDMDGVLADFDKEATYRLGSDSYKFDFTHGPELFWQILNERGDFFASLAPMPDMPLLWKSVKNLDPYVLTALPKDNGELVARQKGAWCAKHLGMNVPVITCRTHEKPSYCRPGDILVDDRNIQDAPWTKAGGIFIHHHSAADTVLRLRDLGVL